MVGLTLTEEQARYLVGMLDERDTALVEMICGNWAEEPTDAQIAEWRAEQAIITPLTDQLAKHRETWAEYDARVARARSL